MIGCKAQLADSTVVVSVGTDIWGHAAICCVLYVGLPHCQHCAATLMFSCTVTLVPSVYKTKYFNVFV